MNNMWDAMMEGVTDSASCPKMNGKPFYQESRDPFAQLCDRIEESASSQFTNPEPATPEDILAARIFRKLTEKERITLVRRFPVTVMKRLHEKAKDNVFETCSSQKEYPTQGALILELGRRTWNKMVLAEYDRLLLTEVVGISRIS